MPTTRGYIQLSMIHLFLIMCPLSTLIHHSETFIFTSFLASIPFNPASFVDDLPFLASKFTSPHLFTDFPMVFPVVFPMVFLHPPPSTHKLLGTGGGASSTRIRSRGSTKAHCAQPMGMIMDKQL